jgi:four helix bundle protein
MFEAYEVAKSAVRELRPALEAVAFHDRDLARQMRRAGASVVLNIAEGWRRMGRDRRQLYLVAAGSNAELRAALDVSEALGYIEGDECAALDGRLDRVSAMLYRLTHAGD